MVVRLLLKHCAGGDAAGTFHTKGRFPMNRSAVPKMMKIYSSQGTECIHTEALANLARNCLETSGQNCSMPLEQQSVGSGVNFPNGTLVHAGMCFTERALESCLTQTDCACRFFITLFCDER